MGKGTTPGRGAPREEREFDQTYLSTEKHGRLVHRDWIAHAMRWGFAHRFCKGKRVVDLGCGPEWNLGKVLCCHGNMGIRPEHYVGVDLSEIEERTTKFYSLRGGVDVTTRADADRLAEEFGSFDVACSFEVIEHVPVEKGLGLLESARRLLGEGGMLLLSTPRNEGHRPARNHIHEYGTDELAELLDEAGFRVERRFGTFGDVKRLEGAMRKAMSSISLSAEQRAAAGQHLATYEDLRAYYSDDVMACFLAPLYPDACKNNLWVCRPKED